MWPPLGINILVPSHIPLMNTIILVVSGITVTCSHLNVIFPNITRAIDSLVCTIILAIQFTLFQVYEYFIASFFISDGVYGSTFYMITGFHGFHVIVGTLFLIVCGFRMFFGHFISYHHVGLEAAI
jgi:heme/copper-type cytochrome/quinol oxidase subunit 3